MRYESESDLYGVISLSTYALDHSQICNLVPIPAFLDDYHTMHFEPLHFNLYLFSNGIQARDFVFFKPLHF